MKYSKNQSLFDSPKPFLKWAGGKKQLLTELDTRLPKELKLGKIKRYVEPFVGAGALLFHIAENYTVDEYIICDINKELIVCYTSIKENLNAVLEHLETISYNYYQANELTQSEIFYNVRHQYNSKLGDFDYANYNEEWNFRTAQTIFLNRTCFNGLFRVNSKGGFNVPFGKYRNPYFYDEDNIIAVNRVLQKTKIISGDFDLTSEYIEDNTFVYLDPPYRPLNSTSNFTSYTPSTFNDDSQRRLADFYYRMSKKGARLMLSNSDPKNVNSDDHFFENLFSNYEINRVQATRMINCNGSKRGTISELIVMNY
jgi:DNA adenine methylase